MIIMISCFFVSLPMFLISFFLCFFDFRQAGSSSYLHISNAFHSFIVGMLMALGGNTLQAVSRADVQLVRTLFDAAQKAHWSHSGNLKQSSLHNLERYLTYAEIPS